ncbi:hypothetical protein H4S08_004724 [Coemansia sp. RSA 1365]|nr:hypothetical protein H4S08_004724 [Coemansia sp. RSA 1365]
MLMPDATDEEVKEAATNEASRSVFAMDVMSSYRSKEARRMLRDVENRNQDIQDINNTIEESIKRIWFLDLLNNMFLDLEGMVVQQQDILDNIEQAVESAHENVEAAHTEVKNATWYRIKARKVSDAYNLR